MQGRFTEEWAGKTVRIYITETKKLEWNPKKNQCGEYIGWETRYVLMARKEWTAARPGRDSAPVISFFKDVAISDEFVTLLELQNAMQAVMAQAKQRNERMYGSHAECREVEMLDIFKLSVTDVLDVEMAKEQATGQGHTHVKLCLSRKDENDCDGFEHEYESRSALYDPHYDPQPSYRERI